MQTVKNLSDIKKEMGNKRPFLIHKHWIKKNIGGIRIANVLQTNGVYIHALNEPNHEITLANNGNGSWLEYKKASDWEINKKTGHCSLFQGEHKEENLIFEISFLSDDQIQKIKNKS